MIEDPLLHLDRDPDSGVGNAELDRGLGGGLLENGDGDADPACLGELQRVADQIDEHLADPELIAPKTSPRAERRIDLSRELEALGLGRLRKHRHRLFHKMNEIEIRGLQLQAAGFDLGEVQDLIDHLQ